MTVLDAFALVAYLEADSANEEVAELLVRPTAIATLNAAEVIDCLSRVRGWSAERLQSDLGELSRAGLVIVPLTVQLAFHAGRLRARHYRPREREVSMADCVAAATALARREALATADPGLAAMLRTEGGEVVALPDSRGRRP